MPSISKPWWEQVTALVSLSVSGAITGFSFVPRAPADLTSPSGMPVHLLAMQEQAQPAPADDTGLRTAIVNVANHFLRMATTRTPAEMEAIIWHHDSIDGVDHGESCAAFASLTLELAAHAVGQQSWVTGGTTYPWPLHKWADVRVDPNPDSLGIISVLQDAQAHHRWHPLGDGYTPQPGDWVLFDGHVEVVTKYSGGVLSTIGGDSLPNFSVNAHRYPAPLGAQGVVGFVNNGDLPGAAGGHPRSGQSGSGAQEVSTGSRRGAPEVTPRIPGARLGGPARRKLTRAAGDMGIPGLPVPPRGGAPARPSPAPEQARVSRRAASQGVSVTAQPEGAALAGRRQAASSPAIPGLPEVAGTARPAVYRRHAPTARRTPAYHANTEEGFISEIAPGAIAAQRRYGVPASVTIAQAIDESGWGRSLLATQDHNLFGIKGAGPAGSAVLPTQEYEGGQMVTTTSPFRIYHNIGESINDHGKLLATSPYYRAAMASRNDPNAFASALTGVYATDPQYGTKLISLMQQYDLYRYDATRGAAHDSPASHSSAGHSLASQSPESQSPASQSPESQSPASQSPASLSSASPSPDSQSPASHRPPSRGVRARGAPAPARTRRPPAPRRPPVVAPTDSAPTPAAPAPQAGSPQPPRRPRPAAAAPGGARRPPAPGRQQAPAGGAAIPGLPADGQAGSAKPARPAPSPEGTAYAVGQPNAYQAVGDAAGQLSAYRAVGDAAGQPSAYRAVGDAAGQPSAYRAVTDAAVSAASPQPKRDATPLDRQKHQVASRRAGPAGRRYQHHIPPAVWTALVGTARAPLLRAEPLYRDIASQTGIRWELLAASDWMQCKARPGYSPVRGEKLGSVNTDGTVYHTRSAALEQCARDLAELARDVYRLDLTAPGELSVRDLANVFAAFRWGGLLRQHHTSAMEFPYSVAGLTAEHTGMRWPNIDSPNAPDRPGGRFRMPFGAVPIVLSLQYPATV